MSNWDGVWIGNWEGAESTGLVNAHLTVNGQSFVSMSPVSSQTDAQTGGGNFVFRRSRKIAKQVEVKPVPKKYINARMGANGSSQSFFSCSGLVGSGVQVFGSSACTMSPLMSVRTDFATRGAAVSILSGVRRHRYETAQIEDELWLMAA